MTSPKLSWTNSSASTCRFLSLFTATPSSTGRQIGACFTHVSGRRGPFGCQAGWRWMLGIVGLFSCLVLSRTITQSELLLTTVTDLTLAPLTAPLIRPLRVHPPSPVFLWGMAQRTDLGRGLDDAKGLHQPSSLCSFAA